MPQLCTSQFITDTGFATGLTPTVTINEALTGTLVGVFNMVETSVGNYIYNFESSNDQIVYFFKYDANSDSVINRYQGNNNNIEREVRVGGMVSINRDTRITQKEINKIAETVIEKLPEQKELDTKNIEETLSLIVSKVDNIDTTFDDSYIITTIKKTEQNIKKDINGIKIPDNKDTSKEIMQEIKKVGEKVDDIEIETIYIKEDQKEIKSQTKKIKTPKEIEEDQLGKDIDRQIKRDKKKKDKEELESILEASLDEVEESLMNDPDFINLLESDDSKMKVPMTES